jgi:hypothetical protein
MQRIDGRYACIIQMRMDHEVILSGSQSKTRMRARASLTSLQLRSLVFVFHHFHSDSRS